MDTSDRQTNNNNNNYAVTQSNGVVCEGWLTKSPPEKIWKTKWRRRWFVLRLSGQIPGQYVLEYYADPTKRKLKGVIDLDQCEQVDAGLQLESRKENFQFMFDVKTSKRIFYLVAKSELEMNKWVECICSVCGLKMHVEEGQDDRYSPQPSGQEFVVSANNATNSATNTLTSTSSLTSNSKTGSLATITSVPTSSTTNTTHSTTVSSNTLTKNKKSISIENSLNNNINTNKNNNSKNNMTKNNTKSISRADSKTSNGRSSVDPRPYIPISECHTGRPINGSFSEIDYVPVLPTKTSGHVPQDECYDVPRQVNPLSESNDAIETTENLLQCVPKAPKIGPNTNSLRLTRKSLDSTVRTLPKVNWDTYPRDSPDPLSSSSNDMTRASVRSHNESVDAKHGSVNDSGIETQRSSSPLSSDFNRDSVQSTDGTAQPPPRPPKPPSLRKSKKQSEICASLPNVSQLYDVPITAVEQNLKNEDHSPTGRHPVHTHSHSDSSPKSPDELYDFPRMNPVSESIKVLDAIDNDIINATVPIALDRSNSRSNNKKHSYTNAPPGYFTNKETVFNYEYRPTLSSGAEDTNAFLTNIDSQADRSPLTPNSASYSMISSSLPNSLSGPPAVNRELKPRRKGSDSDSNPALPSPTMKSATIQLQPPPALTRIHSAPTKRSFRKPGTSGQAHMTLSGTPPRIPSRVPGQYHNREPSTSEDDNGNSSHTANGSRRNSSNDEPIQSKGTVVPPPRRPHDGSEIQYLDLDLDSDAQSQSPRTPNEHIHQRSGSTLSNKELSTNTSQTPVLSSGSTVYKTVDFLKTEAFNKTRLNLENYRNSQ